MKSLCSMHPYHRLPLFFHTFPMLGQYHLSESGHWYPASFQATKHHHWVVAGTRIFSSAQHRTTQNLGSTILFHLYHILVITLATSSSGMNSFGYRNWPHSILDLASWRLGDISDSYLSVSSKFRGRLSVSWSSNFQFVGWNHCRKRYPGEKGSSTHVFL
ncbi:hypothetical protein JAAARDRAFT_362265 [Jaapia argillacea MUCL 33604]|uniref:Uncharacterized protein n=1 Tax=Jaapia argillacea MUCL 33604 TaxID=933084 RepID=A0A067Q7H0_9AGAM|nr:hypothetical protein JAAARDRAFT_362265 [Jaapia argillacea MUCL 33604]